MKRGFLIGILSVILMLMFVGFINNEVSETIPTTEPNNETPAFVIFEVNPTPTPIPIPAPPKEKEEIVIAEYELNEDDVKRIARLLWMSPLRDRTAKAALVWVVCNRIDHPDFPSTIKENITKSEFSYFDSHAHLSDTNLEIARLVLNQWLSERDGYNAGRLVPKDGLYIRYTGVNNRSIEILDSKPTFDNDPKVVYYPMSGAYEYSEDDN